MTQGKQCACDCVCGGCLLLTVLQVQFCVQVHCTCVHWQGFGVGWELGVWCLCLGVERTPDVTVNLTCFRMLHKVCYQSFCTVWIGHLGTFLCTWVTGSGNARKCFVLLSFSLVLRQVRVSGLVYSENGACWIYRDGYTETNGISVFIMVDLNCSICVLF